MIAMFNNINSDRGYVQQGSTVVYHANSILVKGVQFCLCFCANSYLFQY
jgi:hypothetical protein